MNIRTLAHFIKQDEIVIPNINLNDAMKRIRIILRKNYNFSDPTNQCHVELSEPEPSSGKREDKDYYNIYVPGRVNENPSKILMVFELIGILGATTDVKLTVFYLKKEPSLRKYVDLILTELLPNSYGDNEKLKNNKNDLLHQLPKSAKTFALFKKAWAIRKRMMKDYSNDVLDQSSRESKPKIQDFRTKVINKLKWKVSERRLQTVIQLGEAGLLK